MYSKAKIEITARLPNAIQLEDVGVCRGGKWILRNVSLTVPAGATCAVVGHSGSGKSTLLRVLEGYEFPTEGRVRVLGETLGETDISKLRERVRLVGTPGMSSMGGERLDFPLDLTLLKVVATGASGHLVMYEDPSPADAAAAVRLLAEVNLSPGTTWGVASAGEKTRALLARARMPRRDATALPARGAPAHTLQTETLLLLDEPTSGLDPGAREQVVQALERPAVGTTQLIVTHHIEELPACTSMAVVLKDGKLLAAGAAADTLTSENLSSTFKIGLEVAQRDGRWSTTVSRTGSRS